MFNPTDLLPSSLGLDWGMSRARCLDRLDGETIRSGHTSVVVRRVFADAAHDVVLRFTGAEPDAGLSGLTVYLYRSRDSWEPAEGDEEERETLEAEYTRQYEQLVTAYTGQLGPPAYSGTYDPDDAGYPESEAAGDLTVWLVGGNRLHLLYTQQDPELPFEITVACYPAD